MFWARGDNATMYLGLVAFTIVSAIAQFMFEEFDRYMIQHQGY